MSGEEATVTLELEGGYKFRADFGVPGVSALVMDEPEPLGESMGPNAARVLAAAVANCLSASALYCLRKARVEVLGMRTTATVSKTRNQAGRQRIGGIRVRIEPQVEGGETGRLQRCLEIFEDYCVVTASVRGGLRVDVEVTPRSGESSEDAA